MTHDESSSEPPHIAAQTAAGWVAVDATARAESLASGLAHLDSAWHAAIDEVQRVRDFVGTPEQILGNPNTKHGEIAEHVTVGIRRAWDALNGVAPSATFEGVGRTAAVDYLINGRGFQSKYINGLSNALDHVARHAGAYPGFLDANCAYHLPPDQIAQLDQLEATGHIDGLSDRSVRTIREKLRALELGTGRTWRDLLQPGEATYAEVQQGAIHGTLDDRESRLARERDARADDLAHEHRPTLKGAGEAAAYGAAAGAGVGLAGAVYKKWREGRNVFRGEFTAGDWQDIGATTLKGMAGGGVSGAAIYGLTNTAELSAPIAGAVVSAAMGVAELARRQAAGELGMEEFVEQSLLLSTDAAIVAICAGAGQAVFPVPVIGAFVGAVGGRLAAAGVRYLCTKGAAQQVAALEARAAMCIEALDADLRVAVEQIVLRYGHLRSLRAAAFDPVANSQLRLQLSVEYATAVGVPEHDILRSRDDLDLFMRKGP